MATLPSLPLDVLLAILRDLDIVDVVRTGMVSRRSLPPTSALTHYPYLGTPQTCKDLCVGIQHRHVWIDQLEKLRRNEPAFRSATPPLASLSVHELKAFVTRWDKLRLRWNRDDGTRGFAAKGVVRFSAVEDVWLLPGGRSLLVIGNSEVRLCRIELEDDRFSLSVVAKLRLRGGRVDKWSELFIAMVPYPILIHKSGNT